jgi:hypothetical protein
MQERVAFLENDSGTVLGNEALDLAEDGKAHSEKPNA